MTPLTDHTQTSNDSRWRPRRSYMSSAARRARRRPPTNPSSMFRLLNLSQCRLLSRRSRAGETVLREKRPWGDHWHADRLLRADPRGTRFNSTSDGSARATNVADLIMGLNPTTPTTPQSQPPPGPPLHPQSTSRVVSQNLEGTF
jgi:hypothetical protein